MEIINLCRSSAHGLAWHRDSAGLDNNGGKMRLGSGGLWEELKGGVWGKRGSDLHDGRGWKENKERRPQRMSKPLKSVYVTCLNSKKR